MCADISAGGTTITATTGRGRTTTGTSSVRYTMQGDTGKLSAMKSFETYDGLMLTHSLSPGQLPLAQCEIAENACFPANSKERNGRTNEGGTGRKKKEGEKRGRPSTAGPCEN